MCCVSWRWFLGRKHFLFEFIDVLPAHWDAVAVDAERYAIVLASERNRVKGIGSSINVFRNVGRFV